MGEELETIKDDLAGDYRLTANINLSGKDWTPLGSMAAWQGFSGTLHGNGYYIYGLTIDAPNSNYQGLFEYLAAGTVDEWPTLNLPDTLTNYVDYKADPRRSVVAALGIP